MARISYVDPDTVDDPELRAHLERAAERGTPRPESQAIRAHVPAVLRSFSEAWDATFYGGVVDHSLKELCRLYISRSSDCQYCGTQRSPASKGLGEHEVDDLLAFRTSDRFDERQKAALAWAEAILWDPHAADDALWDSLHRSFSEPELVELGFFIALTLGQQRWLATMELRHGEVQVRPRQAAPAGG